MLQQSKAALAARANDTFDEVIPVDLGAFVPGSHEVVIDFKRPGIVRVIRVAELNAGELFSQEFQITDVNSNGTLGVSATGAPSPVPFLIACAGVDQQMRGAWPVGPSNRWKVTLTNANAAGLARRPVLALFIEHTPEARG